MGARGPKPTPNNVRALLGETRPSRQVKETAAPLSEPEFQAWLEDKEANPETHREVWVRVNRYLRSLKMQSEVDTDAVRMYVEAVVLMDRLGKVLAHAPAVVRDTNGSPAANPLMKEWRAQANHVRQLAALFGLAGPTSRIQSRENVVGSEARADDLAG